MSVQASLTDFDTQTVLLLRFCQCGCRPEMHLQLNEFSLPMHELDLAELAELSDLPVHWACSYCGRDTDAICRAAAVIPAERGLPALTHVRMGDDEPVYALLDRGDSDDPEAAARAIFESFPDPQRRRLVAADEVALITGWGRTLSTQAFVRAFFADFLASGKAARIVCPSEGLAYLFARSGEEGPTLDDIAAVLQPAWGVGSEAWLSFSAKEGVGRAGTLVECLGPVRTDPGGATITCIANAAVFERRTREALHACQLTCVRADGDLDRRVLAVAAGELNGSLAIADVARSALVYRRTAAEAAALEAQRLALKFAAIRKTTATIRETFGGRGTVQPAPENSVSLVGEDGDEIVRILLENLLPLNGWRSLTPVQARELVADDALANALARELGEQKACVCAAATSPPCLPTRVCPGDSLEVRATGVDPRAAIAFIGYYGEDGGFERRLSDSLVWATPDFEEGVPDWALQAAWPQLVPEWDALLEQAWARCHPAASAAEDAR